MTSPDPTRPSAPARDELAALAEDELDALDAALGAVVGVYQNADLSPFLDDAARPTAFIAALQALDPPLTVVPLRAAPPSVQGEGLSAAGPPHPEDASWCRHRKGAGDDVNGKWACVRCGVPFNRAALPARSDAGLRTALQETAINRHFALFHDTQRFSSCEEALCARAWAALAAADHDTRAGTGLDG